MFDLLSAVANEEKLLDFALSHICERNSDEVHEVADAILTCYIVNDFKKKNQSFTEEDITSKIKELIADYTMTDLVKKGLVDVDIDSDGQMTFSLTEAGRTKIHD